MNQFNFKKQLLIIFSHFTSQKVLMTIFGVLIIQFCFYSTVALLFKAALIKNTGEVLILAIVSLFKDFIVSISAIVFSLLSIRGILDWKYSSASQALTEAIKQTSNITQDVHETISQIEEGRSRSHFENE